MYSFSEFSKNILKANVPLTKDQFDTLRCRKEDLRRLASKEVPLAKKRKILMKSDLAEDILSPVLKVLDSLSTDEDEDPTDDSCSDECTESESTGANDDVHDEEERGSADSIKANDGDDDEEDRSSTVEPKNEYASIGSKPGMMYTCAEPGCGAAYPYLRNLSRHIKIKHGRHVDGRPASPSAIERAKASSRCRSSCTKSRSSAYGGSMENPRWEVVHLT
jgi:hypothetical protein